MLDCYSVIFETLTLVGGDVIGGHLIRVAHEKLATGNSRDIPRFAFDSCEARDFGILLRRSFYEGQLSAITRNYQMTAGQDDLPIAVAPALPLPRSSIYIQTSQNPFIQSVDVTFIKN